MKIKELKLENGATVVGVEIEGSHSTAIYFGFRVGGRSEDKENMGISHFVEHMMFKGSRGYPSAKALSETVDAMGGSWNAFTDKELTVYLLWVSAEKFDSALDVVGDMVSTPIFNQAELEREAGTIIEEINRYEDMPEYNIEDLLYETTFGQNEMGRPILGSKETVLSVDSKKMRDYYERMYTGENLVVAVVGKLPEGWTEKVKKYALRFTRGKKNNYNESSFSSNRHFLKKKKTEQVQIGIGVPSISMADNQREAAQVLSTIIGGYMSSRLFTEIREKRGWAYSVYATSSFFSNTGVLEIVAGVRADKVLESIELIKTEILNFAKTLTEEEVERAKGHLVGVLGLRFESPNNVANFISKRLLTMGALEKPEEVMARMEKVTKRDVVEIANQILKPDRIYLALIGPFQDEEKFAKILTQ